MQKKNSKTEIDNLGDAEFETQVIRMLRDLTEYGKHIREKMKATVSEISKKSVGN